MKWTHWISALTLAVLLSACGGAKPFNETDHEEGEAHAAEEGHEEAPDRTTILPRPTLAFGWAGRSPRARGETTAGSRNPSSVQVGGSRVRGETVETKRLT